MNFKCHNCGASNKFSTFLKSQNELLYQEYIYERFKFKNEYRWTEKKAEERETRINAVFLEKYKDDPIQKLACVKDLDKDHEAVQYVISRKIPFKVWDELYYSENYIKWVHENVDNSNYKEDRLPKSDPRIVIPFLTKSKKIFAYQGRSLINSDKVLRYVTAKKNEDSFLVYGFDKIDEKKEHIFVLEGPFDATFVNNSLAVAGSALKKLMQIKSKKFVYVFDNQPRNKEIVDLFDTVIRDGGKVVIFPDEVVDKDINDMIQSGYTKTEVNKLLEDNIYQGLQAKLRFEKWKKI